MKPEFTQWQKDELCYLVGDWYVAWKEKLINYEQETHNLSQACEYFCQLIIRNKDKYYLNDDQLNFILKKVFIWKYCVEDNLVTCYKTKLHTFGMKKELLKLEICDDIEELKNMMN